MQSWATTQLPGRTDNEIKNLWNSSIKKKLRQRGIDPNSHNPVPELKDDEKKTSPGNTNCSEASSSRNHGPGRVQNPDASGPKLGHKFILDRFSASEESSAENLNASEFSGFYPFHHHLMNAGPIHCFDFNPKPCEVNTECGPTFLPPPVNPLPSDNPSLLSHATNKFHNWESNAGSTSLRSNGTTSYSLSDTKAFTWGSVKLHKDPQMSLSAMGEADQEEIKWTECFQSPLFLGGQAQSFHGGGRAKFGAQFGLSDGYSESIAMNDQNK